MNLEQLEASFRKKSEKSEYVKGYQDQLDYEEEQKRRQSALKAEENRIAKLRRLRKQINETSTSEEGETPNMNRPSSGAEEVRLKREAGIDVPIAGDIEGHFGKKDPGL